MSAGKDLPVVYLPEALAAQTASLLDSFAQRGPSEGVVYWFGLELAGRAVVTTLIVPAADTTGGRVSTSAESNAEAVTEIVGTPLVYLGQAHSHPGWQVDHSSVDDRETFARFDGAISVVVPWFGRYGFALRDCGVHRHVAGRYRRVDRVADHLRLIPSLRDLRTAPSASGL
jgi:hypothetical protein